MDTCLSRRRSNVRLGEVREGLRQRIGQLRHVSGGHLLVKAKQLRVQELGGFTRLRHVGAFNRIARIGA